MGSLSTAQLIATVLVIGLLLLAAGVLIGRKSARSTRGSVGVIKRTRQVGTFETRDTKGRLVSLIIYQEYLDAGIRNDPSAERKGRRQIMTNDGRHVDKIATRQYRVAGTAELLTSEDANAP